MRTDCCIQLDIDKLLMHHHCLSTQLDKHGRHLKDKQQIVHKTGDSSKHQVKAA